MTVKCLVPTTHAKTPTIFIRGLCMSHYVYATRLVKRKLTTWAKLEKAKKSLPSHRKSGDVVHNYFLGK